MRVLAAPLLAAQLHNTHTCLIGASANGSHGRLVADADGDGRAILQAKKNSVVVGAIGVTAKGGTLSVN
eukprot:gene37670-723_t